MKKISFVLALFALCLNVAFANPIDPVKALETANSFWKSQIKENESLVLKSPQKMAKAGSRISIHENAPQYYICTPENNGGFIIVSGDDALTPIIGYSTETINENNEMPAVLIEWLNEYSEYVNAVRKGEAEPVKKSTRAGKTAIAPMLKTTWNQGAPYNNLCPEVNGQKTPTGCTATAMAQIMKFHEWPITPIKAISWTSNITGEKETIDLTKRKYNWSNMLPHYRNGYTKEQAHEVAQLMVDVGKAISSSYSVDGTGSNDSYAAKAFVNVFDYSKSIQLIKRTDSTEEEYMAAIRNNLTAKRPVMYVGTGVNYEGGHAFVCDGIDENDLLHIDWGWDGAYNGYFDMTYMAPAGIGTGGGTGSYNVAQSIIVNIAPAKETDVNNAAPTLYKAAILIPDTEDEVYNYTANYSNNIANFRLGTYVINRSHSTLELEFALGIEQKDGTYKIIDSIKVEESLQPMYYIGYYIDFGIDIANKNSNSYIEKGTHKLRVLYKNREGKFVNMNGDQNRLMLDVNETSAKVYMALPDINVSTVELKSDGYRVGSKVKFNAKFINKNTYNSTVIVVPVLNTTLANGTIVHDTLKNSRKLFEVIDNKDIYVEFNTSELFKHAGKCNISFAYNLSSYYSDNLTYNAKIAESVNGKSSTFTVKTESQKGTPVVTSIKAENITNGKVLNVSATLANQSNAGYKYSANIALAIRNKSNNKIYILDQKDGVVLEKSQSITLSYKSADYFPTIPAGNYEVLMYELNGNNKNTIEQTVEKTIQISNDSNAIPYINGKTSICGKSVTPGDSVKVYFTVSSYNGDFEGYIRFNTINGLAPVLRSDYIPVAISNAENQELHTTCWCGPNTPDGKWDLTIKYFDKNKRELGVVSHNTFTFPDNNYFWVGEPEVGIDDIEYDGIYIKVYDGKLHVYGTEGKEVSLYSIDGRMIYNGTNTSFDVTNGIYIIIIDNSKVIKAIVK